MSKPNTNRILVVEDHGLLLQALAGLLESHGYVVDTAENGVEALARMREAKPDLILSDIMMPQMDGYTFYKEVRSHPNWVRIPFIFLTARGQHEDIKRGKALGVEDYLTKPFDTEEVIIAVRSRLERAAALQEASEMEFEQLKQEIVNVLSHELRTPLTYISGYTELALEDATNLSTDELISFLAGIKKGADRLRKLVENLLLGVQIDTQRCAEEYNTFAKVQKGIGEVVRQTAKAYEAQAREKSIRINVEISPDLPPVRMYRPFLSDALSRIIDNAIKFTAETPAQITVRAKATDEWVDITVSDQGIGINPEHVDDIFRRLQQSDRAKTEQQGSGMGLFISNSLVELHEGTIEVETAPGEGSTFTVRIPVVKSKSDQDQPPSV